MADNFAALNLTTLENVILKKNYSLHFLRVGTNRVVELDNSQGNMLAWKEGKSLVTLLQKLNEEYGKDPLRYKPFFPSKIIKSSLDYCIMDGAKLSIKKNRYSFVGILRSWNGDLLLLKQRKSLPALLNYIEEFCNQNYSIDPEAL